MGSGVRPVGALLVILVSATAHNILHDFRRRARQSRTIASMATSTDQRPDPDLLLAKVKQQELKARRGKLRIYFGSSAGVGKTYAMLVAARKLLSEGRTVLVGVVETHGRAE